MTQEFSYDVDLDFCFHLQDMVIQQDDEIRLKIVGTRVDASDIVSTHYSLLNLCPRKLFVTDPRQLNESRGHAATASDKCLLKRSPRHTRDMSYDITRPKHCRIPRYKGHNCLNHSMWQSKTILNVLYRRSLGGGQSSDPWRSGLMYVLHTV